MPTTAQSTGDQLREILDNRAEMRRYRWAVFSIFASLSYLIGFCYVAGMSVWVSAVFFLIFFGLSTVVTRIRVEAGYPMHDFAFRPEDICRDGIRHTSGWTHEPHTILLSPLFHLCPS